MASNDVEVLDPSAKVETHKEDAPEIALNRRHFMTALGVAGAVAGVALVSTPIASAQQPKPNGYLEADVLNFLLNLKYLKATFYAYLALGTDLPPASQVTNGSGGVFNQPPKMVFTGANAAQITDLFNEMYYDELNQLIDLRALIGTAVVARQTMNLLGTGTSTTATNPALTPSQAIATARMLEDLSASAFAGALIYLTGKNLAYATQVLACDGFHSGAIRLVTIQSGASYQGTQSLTTLQVGTASGSTTVYGFFGTVVPVVGSAISGNGIPSGAVITAVATVASAAPTGVLVKGNTTIGTVSSVTGLAVGQPVTGTNIPALTVITAVGTNSITLSNAPTASTTVSPTGTLTSGSTTITGVSATTGLLVGQPITAAAGIPAGATITAIKTTAPFTITMSAAATVSNLVTPTGATTNGSFNVTVSSATGLIVGNVITGAGIPSSPATTIGSINGTVITLSAAATATATGVALSSPTTITLTSPTNQALSVAKSTMTITQPANLTTSTTAIVVVADSLDVVPADLGTAAASAGGPAAVPSSSPTMYQGFFNTAGSGTGNANTPSGFAFARSFSQVLAVLYANTTIQTTQGGFYPVGVSGNINVV